MEDLICLLATVRTLKANVDLGQIKCLYDKIFIVNVREFYKFKQAPWEKGCWALRKKERKNKK